MNFLTFPPVMGLQSGLHFCNTTTGFLTQVGCACRLLCQQGLHNYTHSGSWTPPPHVKLSEAPASVFRIKVRAVSLTDARLRILCCAQTNHYITLFSAQPDCSPPTVLVHVPFAQHVIIFTVVNTLGSGGKLTFSCSRFGPRCLPKIFHKWSDTERK